MNHDQGSGPYGYLQKGQNILNPATFLYVSRASDFVSHVCLFLNFGSLIYFGVLFGIVHIFY